MLVRTRLKSVSFNKVASLHEGQITRNQNTGFPYTVCKYFNIYRKTIVEENRPFTFSDIAEYHQESFKADTVYTYIEPRTYSNIFSVNQFQPTRGPSKDHVVRDTGNVYEEIQKTNRRSDVMIPLAEMGGEFKSFFQEKQRASVLGRPVPSVPGGGGGESNATDGDSSKEKKKSPTPSIPKRDPSTKVSSGAKLPPKPNPYVNEIPRGIVKFETYREKSILSSGFSIKLDTYPAVQSQKMKRGLKFRNYLGKEKNS